MILFCRMLYLHGVWNSNRYTKQRNSMERAETSARVSCSRTSRPFSLQHELNDRFLDL